MDRGSQAMHRGNQFMDRGNETSGHRRRIHVPFPNQGTGNETSGHRRRIHVPFPNQETCGMRAVNDMSRFLRIIGGRVAKTWILAMASYDSEQVP